MFKDAEGLSRQFLGTGGKERVADPGRHGEAVETMVVGGVEET